jgi:hypothetical protein
MNYKVRTWKEIQEANKALVATGKKIDWNAIAVYVMCVLFAADLLVNIIRV